VNFTDGKPRYATEDDLKACWSGGKPGECFRCDLCGHKFKLGDYWRWQYTNDTPGASGNPKVCEKCDGTKASIVAKQKRILAAYNNPSILAGQLFAAELALRQQAEKYRKLVETGFKEGRECPNDLLDEESDWTNSNTRAALAALDQPTDFQYLMAHDAMLQRDMKLPEEKP